MQLLGHRHLEVVCRRRVTETTPGRVGGPHQPFLVELVAHADARERDSGLGNPLHRGGAGHAILEQPITDHEELHRPLRLLQRQPERLGETGAVAQTAALNAARERLDSRGDPWAAIRRIG